MRERRSSSPSMTIIPQHVHNVAQACGRSQCGLLCLSLWGPARKGVTFTGCFQLDKPRCLVLNGLIEGRANRWSRSWLKRHRWSPQSIGIWQVFLQIDIGGFAPSSLELMCEGNFPSTLLKIIVGRTHVDELFPINTGFHMLIFHPSCRLTCVTLPAEAAGSTKASKTHRELKVCDVAKL